MEGRAKGQILHGSATPTEAVRRAVHRRQMRQRELVRRYGGIRRPSPNGANELLSRTYQPDLGSPACPPSRLSRRLSSSLCGAIRCCRSTNAFCPAADHPAGDQAGVASLPAAARHLSGRAMLQGVAICHAAGICRRGSPTLIDAVAPWRSGRSGRIPGSASPQGRIRPPS